MRAVLSDLNGKRFRASLLSLMTASLCATLAAGCGGPAALDSPEAHASADALYTAITSRRVDLMSDVETRLSSLNQAGKLSKNALDELTAIISTARREKWQDAAEELDAFIRNQPVHDHSH